jgi:TetR/AcrR family transcriptional regulator
MEVPMQPQPLETPTGTTGKIASRLWSAARTEFAARGYHGARVQGIARRAGCNVALLYRHWASKRALYVEILRSIWIGNAEQVVSRLADAAGARGVVNAYLDTRLADPEASQILIREYLDGGPFLRELHAADPSIADPLRAAAETLRRGNGHALRSGVDPQLAVFTVGALSALAAAAHQTAEPFYEGPPLERGDWKRHLEDLLLHGLEEGGGSHN